MYFVLGRIACGHNMSTCNPAAKVTLFPDTTKSPDIPLLKNALNIRNM